MVTEHAIKRYSERVEPNFTVVGKFEKLELHKKIVELFNKASLLYEGTFYDGNPLERFYFNNGIIMVYKDKKITTIWKIKEYKEKIKTINTNKNKLKSWNKKLVKLTNENNSIKYTIEFLGNQKKVNEKLLRNANLILDEIVEESTILSKKISGLKLLNTTLIYNLIYTKNNSPINFYRVKRKQVLEDTIDRLKEGLELIKEDV